MDGVRHPWKLCIHHASGTKPDGPQRARSQKAGPFSSENMPALGAWVTVVQGGSVGGPRQRKANMQNTPALISAASLDGKVTVLYPNNLVLTHGFKGEAVKRVPDVAVERLRPFTGTETSLQLLEKALRTAIKAGLQSGKGLLYQRQSAAPESPSCAASPCKSPLRKGGAKRVRSPSREADIHETGPGTLQSSCSEPETPQKLPRVAEALDKGTARSPSRDLVDVVDKLQEIIKEPLLERPESMLPKKVQDGSPRKKQHAFTTSVGRLLRESGCRRMAQVDLEAGLQCNGFDADEILMGLKRLDAANKILMMDSLVFLV